MVAIIGELPRPGMGFQWPVDQAVHSIGADATIANGPPDSWRDRTAVRIYTKTGDDGSTGLLGAGRVSKDDIRVAVYGTVDEVNAALGLARALRLDADADALASRLQEELFVLGSALADPSPDGPFHRAITTNHVAGLESAIDSLEAQLEPLTQFILPGGTPAAAQVHLARTVCRRAERLAVTLARTPGSTSPRRSSFT